MVLVLNIILMKMTYRNIYLLMIYYLNIIQNAVYCRERFCSQTYIVLQYKEIVKWSCL